MNSSTQDDYEARLARRDEIVRKVMIEYGRPTSDHSLLPAAIEVAKREWAEYAAADGLKDWRENVAEIIQAFLWSYPALEAEGAVDSLGGCESANSLALLVTTLAADVRRQEDRAAADHEYQMDQVEQQRGDAAWDVETYTLTEPGSAGRVKEKLLRMGFEQVGGSYFNGLPERESFGIAGLPMFLSTEDENEVVMLDPSAQAYRNVILDEIDVPF
jgi:hypothetical protein